MVRYGCYGLLLLTVVSYVWLWSAMVDYVWLPMISDGFVIVGYVWLWLVCGCLWLAVVLYV